MEGGLRITSRAQRQERTLITVITAVFNGCQALEKTIQSVLAQKNHSLEYIVIDGGSTDGTLDILRKYDKDLGYWMSAPDKGIYDAFNKGWKLASDESFVLFLGAGDLLISLPDEKVIIPSEVVYGNVVFDEGTKFTSKVDFRLKLGNTVHHQAMLVKKSLSPASPFDLRFGTYADFDFNQRLFKQKVTFTYAGDFEAYALPGGISQAFRMGESLRIVYKNFGFFYAGLAFVYYIAQRIRNRIAGRQI
jgi:glycosyltransferase involved in cell wall biosynthesis